MILLYTALLGPHIFFYFQAGELVIRASVEPLLDQYRPPGISELKLDKLELGTVAPKIEGLLIDWLSTPSLNTLSFAPSDVARGLNVLFAFILSLGS